MNASKQSRIYVGYVIKVVPRSGEAQYHGPFATQSRAEEYALSFPTDISFTHTIEELIIPHAMHVYIETQY